MAGEIERLDFRIEDWAGRDRAWEWIGFDQVLPDPDQVAARKGYSTYEWIAVLKFLLTDPHVWACYSSRKSGTLSQEWEIEVGKGPGAARAHKLIKDWLEGQNVYQIIGEILDAPFFGTRPIEVIWQAGNGRWLPDRVVGRPTEWFVFDLENRVRFLSKGNMIQGELPPDNKILLPQHNASYENPYGERILSRCFWPVVWKRSSQKFWAIFAEKYGMPWVVGKVPKGTNEVERATILGKLAQMVQDAVAVINDDESVEFMGQGAKTLSVEVFEGLAAHADAQISKAVLGQTLTTEAGRKGSYSLGMVHADVRQDLLEQDQRLVAETMDLLFRWITELNFGMGTAAPRWGWYQEEDVQKDRADRDEVLSKQGVRFSKGYYQRTYKLEDDDFEIG
jgi:phage gp29-like protein